MKQDKNTSDMSEPTQSKVSYSLEGEDLILASLLREVGRGIYIDVGANHPTLINNTYRFYQMGWSGLAVDGNDSFAQAWAEQRPNDIFVQGLVSDEIKDAEFFVFPDDTISSMDAGTSKRYAARFDEKNVEVRRIRTITLESLRQSYLPEGEIHLLSVDVEGEDLNVLMGGNLGSMRPGVVVVETKNCSLYQPLESDIVRYMTNIGYRFVAKTPLDAFFVWPDKPYLSWIPKPLISGI